jgi:hydrogenase maturation protease
LHAGERILIYAYGNPGRQDDGLGNRLIEELGKWIDNQGIEWVDLESDYQLNIEDSLRIADKDVVIFVDASNEDIEDINFSVVEPSEGRSEFTTHSASPSFVLALCIQLYAKHPETWLLQIRGYSWEFQEGLSEKAEKNLEKALEFLKKKLADRPPRVLKTDIQGF